jgi:hypothetical protein
MRDNVCITRNCMLLCKVHGAIVHHTVTCRAKYSLFKSFVLERISTKVLRSRL